MCENSFRSARRIANSEIRCAKSPEIASTWLKLTPEISARAFSHSLDPSLPLATDRFEEYEMFESFLIFVTFPAGGSDG